MAQKLATTGVQYVPSLGVTDIIFGIICQHYANKTDKDYSNQCQIIAMALVSRSAREIFREQLGWTADNSIQTSSRDEFYNALTNKLLGTADSVEANTRAIARLESNVQPEGYKTASACSEGKYRTYHNVSATVCNVLRKNNNAWKHPSTGEWFYDEVKYCEELEARVESNEFSCNQKRTIKHIWDSNKPQPENAKTKSRKKKKQTTPVQITSSTPVQKTSQEIEELIEEIKDIPNIKMGVVYSKAYKMLSNNKKIDIAKLTLAGGYTNKKQFLISNYPNELFYFLTIASS